MDTDCCIIGGGPAGAFLAYLLARQGIRVTLLEAQKDFEREFRGDTLHASVLEILDQVGLAERLLRLPHSKAKTTNYVTEEGTFVISDYSSLKTKFPFVTLLPQSRFLEFITEEARRYPNFKLLLGANAQGLLEAGDSIGGVVYRDAEGLHTLQAALTVAADGRSSRIRQLAAMEAVASPPPMDILWFRLPRQPGDPKQDSLSSYYGRGYFVCLLDRGDYWQASYIIAKGAYPKIRAQGLEKFRSSIVALLPMFQDRIHALRDWSQIALLSTGISRLKRWYRPGLLFLGDSAHVMSTVGGVGINCAIHDAVEAANILSGPLSEKRLSIREISKVQRRRELPTRLMQCIQAMTQKTVVAKALRPGRAYQVPFWLRIPLIRRLSAYMIAYGLRPARIAHTQSREPGAMDQTAEGVGRAASLRLSVVIPCRNAAKTIGVCLSSLKRQSYPAHEIIVVDDASCDDSAEIVSRENVILIRRSHCAGAGTARSEGASRATGDIIAFIDSDCWAPEDWLARIAGAFESDPGLGGIGGKYTHLPAVSLMGNLIRCEEEYLHYVFSQQPEDVNPAGGHAAFRRALWEEGRSQRELQFFQGMGSGEDTVVCNELRALAKIKYDYSLEVFHHPCETDRYFRRHINRGISRSTIVMNALSSRTESSLALKAYGGWGLFLGSLFLMPAALSLPLWFFNPALAAGLLSGSVILSAVLSRHFFRFIDSLHAGRSGASSSPLKWLFTFRLILLLRSLCWILGAGTGVCRHLRFKAGLLWNVACSIAHFWRPGRISKLFYFVTAQCNARCEFCFNLENVVAWKQRKPSELTLEEVARVARKLGRLPYLTLSGGEPFLRQDLPRLVETFYRHAKTQWVTIPTNAALSRKVVDSTLEILRRCPGLLLTVQVSMDSMEGDHDRSRKIAGGFAGLTRTLMALSRIRRHHKNLRIQIATCYDDFNILRINEIIDYCRTNFEYDQQMFYLIRDPDALITQRNARLVPSYLDLVAKNGKHEWSRHRRSLWSRAVRTFQAKTYSDIADITTTRRYFRPCYATRKFVTLYDDGQISPCEVLEKTKLGNIRDFDFDFYKLKRARRLGDYHSREIVARKCNCDWTCATPINILYDPSGLVSVMKGLFNPDKAVKR